MSSLFNSGPSLNDVASSRSGDKRRGVRKGTFSCWECKHRKKRCEFKSTSSSICVSCQRRGLSCTSQELADPGHGDYEGVGKRLDQVEAIVSQLVQQRTIQKPRVQSSKLSRRVNQSTLDNAISRKSSPDMLNRKSLLRALANHAIQIPSSTLLSTGQDPRSICRSLSNYLYSIFPDPTIAVPILIHGDIFNPSTKSLPRTLKMVAGMNKRELEKPGLPSPTAHPIHIASKLIQLALCLQQDGSKSGVPADFNGSAAAASRYVEIASRYVTSQDLLVDSIEGLEVLLLEAYYNISGNNLRAAWLIVRRALGIAQLIGLPQLAEQAGCHVESMWFRFVKAERFLSLILGLPSTVADQDFASQRMLTADEPCERLERLHTVIVGRLIARNLAIQRLRRQKREELYDHSKETQNIEQMLKQVARSSPENWWQASTLDNVATDIEVMEKTAKLLSQSQHYILHVLLYQPYLMQNYNVQSSINIDPNHSIDYAYSTLALVSAGREALSRFIILRNFYRSALYVTLDGKAFTVAVALLLAYLKGHRLDYPNVLEYHRQNDLGLLHKAITCMEETSHCNNDSSGRSLAQTLRKLFEFEADAAAGACYQIWSEDDVPGERNISDEYRLKIPIPYFGTVNIARQDLMGSQPIPDPVLGWMQGLELDVSPDPGAKETNPDVPSPDLMYGDLSDLTMPKLDDGLPSTLHQ